MPAWTFLEFKNQEIKLTQVKPKSSHSLLLFTIASKLLINRNNFSICQVKIEKDVATTNAEDSSYSEPLNS